MATHSSVLAWRIPGTGEPGLVIKNLPANAGKRHNVRSLVQKDPLEEGMATHSSILAWRIPGMGSLVGCCLWGRTESDMTEVT